LFVSSRELIKKLPFASISKFSFCGGIKVCSWLASGKLIFSCEVVSKVVDTMKNISNRNTTSINGVRLILASSSILLLWKFMISGQFAAFAVQVLDQFHGFLLHRHHQFIDFTLQMPVKDKAWYGNG
jgi:hypothetical protein